jgi:hypothetical protein
MSFNFVAADKMAVVSLPILLPYSCAIYYLLCVNTVLIAVQNGHNFPCLRILITNGKAADNFQCK